MGKYYRITPEGTRDLIFEECTLRRKLEEQMKKLFRSRGFSEVVTPEIEFLDVFTLTHHAISEESMYKLSDRKGRLIALRPDSTMPIARLVSTRLKDQPLPIRLFYNQKVYHATPSLTGKSDEELQSGIEIIGVSGKRADLEALSMAVEVLENCKSSNYRLEIGHIAIFNRLMKKLNIDDELKEEIRLVIERKNYPALNDLVDSRLSAENAAQIKQLPRLFGGDEIFDKAINLFKDSEITETIEYLRSLYNALQRLGLGEKISVDLVIVNRINYYTGVIFRGYISGFGRAVLSGGRYDNLFAEFGMPNPAIGFGINLDAVLASFLENKRICSGCETELLVYAAEGYEMEGVVYLKQQTEKGIVTEYSVFDSLDRSLSYAKNKEIPRVAVVADHVEIIMTKDGENQ